MGPGWWAPGRLLASSFTPRFAWGKDEANLERRVLARAVRWHCEERVLVHGNKTVVFA